LLITLSLSRLPLVLVLIQKRNYLPRRDVRDRPRIRSPIPLPFRRSRWSAAPVIPALVFRRLPQVTRDISISIHQKPVDGYHIDYRDLKTIFRGIPQIDQTIRSFFLFSVVIDTAKAMVPVLQYGASKSAK